MIKGLNHAGIVVNNLEDSIRFYSNVIGLPVARMIERKGSPISAVVGYDDVHIKAALLDLGDGHFLELIQYLNPIASDRPTNERAVKNIGKTHESKKVLLSVVMPLFSRLQLVRMLKLVLAP